VQCALCARARSLESLSLHSCHTSRTHLHRVLVHPVLPPRLDSATTHSPGTARSPRSHTNVSPITHRVHDQRGSFSRWFEYTCLNRSTQSNSTIHMLTDQYTEIWRDHALSYRATNFKAHTISHPAHSYLTYSGVLQAMNGCRRMTGIVPFTSTANTIHALSARNECA
jgi:hypothetical protein